MREYLKIEIKVASNKRCIFYSGDLLIDKDIRDNIRFFLKLVKEFISVKYPYERFMVYMNGEPEYKGWFSIYNKHVMNIEHYVLRQKEERIITIPTWYIDYEEGVLFHNIICLSDLSVLNKQTIEFFGDFSEKDNDFFYEIAEQISLNSSWKYVIYDLNNKYCLKKRKQILINSLSKANQESYFKHKMEFTNRTETLFNPLHSELIFIYSDINKAKEAYNKGEFVLYETKQGLNFYGSWRQQDWENKKNILETLNHTIIKGKEIDINPLYREAQKQFAIDALQYQTDNSSYYFGIEKDDTHFTYKIIRDKDGNLKQVIFRLSDFYPI